MLKPATVDNLNKVYPQYSFIREAGSIYCFDADHNNQKVAQCGYTDFFSFYSMTDKISPEHFKDVQTAIKQLLSSYLFFCHPFFEISRKKFYLYALQSIYTDRLFMGQQVVVQYVTKFQDEQIYWSPEIQMGNEKFYLHLTNYNTVNEFQIHITNAVGKMFDLSITLDEIKNDYSKLTYFFFDVMLKPYLGIDAACLTMDHFKVIDMVII